MHLAVTVCAASVEEENRVSSPWSSGVARGDMALRAESRIRNLKETIVNRSMRLMAVGAVLDDRRVFPEERPAPLRVARVAVLVDAGLLKHGWVRRAVRVVAVCTRHLALAQRHV